MGRTGRQGRGIERPQLTEQFNVGHVCDLGEADAGPGGCSVVTEVKTYIHVAAAEETERKAKAAPSTAATRSAAGVWDNSLLAKSIFLHTLTEKSKKKGGRRLPLCHCMAWWCGCAFWLAVSMAAWLACADAWASLGAIEAAVRCCRKRPATCMQT